MQFKIQITLLLSLTLAFSSCLPKIEDPVYIPPYSGYWYIDDEKVESDYTRRFESFGTYLYAQSKSINATSDIVHLLEIHYGGGLPSDGTYTIVGKEDDLDLTNKEVFITMHNGLTGTRYNSTNDTKTVGISIMENGRMKVTAPTITLKKEYGDGKDSILFSCEIIELAD